MEGSIVSFDVQNLAVFELFGIEVWLTETIRNTWIVMGILLLFAVAVRITLGTYKAKPTGFQNFVELIVEAFDRFVTSTAGKRLSYLGPWFFAVFTFILIANISGLMLLRPPTADWTVTFSLALVTFILIQVMAFYYQPREKIKDLLTPWPFFLPINLLGELARPISLSFRLFGNVLGGMILITLVYSIAPIPARFGFPIVLHFAFDLIFGVLQAYIFTVLSLAFIGLAAGTSQD